MAPPCAHASFEWLGVPEGVFANGEEGRLGGLAGGVAASDATGDVYIADGSHHRVTVFDARGKFLEAWGWGVTDEVTKAFQHCGPPPTHEPCAAEGVGGEEGASEFAAPWGVAVDQTNGDVFVLDRSRRSGVVQVFSASGEFISSFGETGGQGQPVSESPGLIRTVIKSGIAVDDTTGDVFVADHNNDIESEARVMVFVPVTPGDFSSYEYAGMGQDFAKVHPVTVATDAEGNVYVGSAETVYKFAAGDHSTPVWAHTDPKDIEGMTVNPEAGVRGRVFYFTSVTHKFHELSSVTGEQIAGAEWPGVELEVGGKKVREEETPGLGFDPVFEWGGGRPAGVLYAIDRVLGFGLVFVKPPLFPPSVGSVSVSGVVSDSALFEARVTPHGFDTHYSFQYGTEDCVEHLCTKEVPAPLGGDAGDGGESVRVSASVSGLVPGMTYYFRVVVSSHCHPDEPLVLCTVTSPEVPPADSFMTFGLGVSGLPDGRVFELVSPPDKAGGDVFPLMVSTANCELCMPGVNRQRFPMQSTVDGGRMVYEGDPFSVSGDAVSENEYLSSRGGGGGWVVPPRDLSPVLAGKASPQGYKAFSDDLSQGVLYEIERSFEGAPSGYPDLYLQDTASGVLRALITKAPSNRAAKEFQLNFAGASSDFGHLIFEANGVLATESSPGAADGPAGESNLYEWVNGGLRLVNILPDETTEAGAVFGGGNPNFSHAVSRDGSRLFWTGENHAHGHFGRLYVRVNDERTLEVPDGEDGAFVTASADGSRVLLNDGRVYRVGGEEVVEEADLTNGQHGFQGILGASEDLSSVYFVDTAVLTGAEENDQGAVAGTGEDNLYLWRGGVVRFVAPLSGADNTTDVYRLEPPNATGDWSSSPPSRTANVTTDGRYVAFMSQAGLIKGTNSAGVFEVYEYDASTGRLVCASCNPTKEHPIGPSVLSTTKAGAGVPQPLSLSDNGRVFFDSYDQLSPLDKNGGFEDVYEYEPDGLGSCAMPGGCILLISTRQEETNSSFINATPSGSDIFFATRSPLVPQDQDDLMDLYDARVNGTPPPPPPTPPCSGEEECKTPMPPEPVFGIGSSNTLSGSDNLITLPSPPAPSLPSTSPSGSPSRAVLLARALRACRKQQRTKKARARCEARARARYAPKTKSKTTRTTVRKNSSKSAGSSK